MEKDYSRWYTDVVLQARLADYAPVKGCMVIRPDGYVLWERMKSILDGMLKETGHVNAYFPLFIPEKYIEKEKDHVEGFAPECAVVTHGGGKKLEENLYVRPTSETVIWAMYKKWIMSYRDLPILINQWANVVRWEMRTRLFLRTTEFLWQEGHTAHATKGEAQEEALKILEIYRTFAENHLAIPVITGVKSDSEKFAGAVETYCIEGMMQDRKALQAGTSHDLGQNFAKAFDVTFQDVDGERKSVWATSWGVSTRLVGAMIMVHSDNRGLVIPPKIASSQAVVIPIWYNDEEKKKVSEYIARLVEKIPGTVRLEVDDREERTSGWKFHEWELMGAPLRIEVGPRDVANNSVVLVHRYDSSKHNVPQDRAGEEIVRRLDFIQEEMFNKASDFMKRNTYETNSFEEFAENVDQKGGFYWMHWCGVYSCEEKIKEKTKATIRCIPYDKAGSSPGKCVICGAKSSTRVLFARAY